MSKLKQRVHSFLWYANNWISIFGAIATTVSGVFLLLFFALEILGLLPHFSVYLSLVIYTLLPAFFGMGLFLIPVGMLIKRLRKKREESEDLKVFEQPTPFFPTIDLNNPQTRRTAVVVGLLTLANIVIVGIVSVEAIEFTETVQFCGAVCHKPMEPEYVTHQFSPHSKVRCAACHVGPGAASFIKAKVNGMRQLLMMVNGSYARPIATPVHGLRAAKYTCETCHGRSKEYNDRFIEHKLYNTDEQNTERTIQLVMKLGKQSSKASRGRGVHWHIENPVWYKAADTRRQVIPWVRAKIDGKVFEYRSTEPTPKVVETHKNDAHAPKEEVRQMDCIDCHNRPTHIFMPPNTILDQMMAAGHIPQKLPYIKREALRLLETTYTNNDQAKQSMTGLDTFYQKNYPEVHKQHKDDIKKITDMLYKVYQRTQFPHMKVTWKSYPNHIGHSNFAGCFRCHDGKHKSSEGRVIRADCNLCHDLVNYGEKAKMYPPKHQVECSKCHTISADPEARHRDIRPTRQQCLSCHDKQEKTFLAAKQQDASLKWSHECTTCHNVHNTLTLTKPQSNCSSCHETLLTKNKQHAVHLQKGLACQTCHTPHAWKVIQINEEKSCHSCHVKKEELKNLRVFRHDKKSPTPLHR